MSFAVKRDGKIKARTKTDNDAFIWLLRHQPHSVSHATTYEGWSIEKSKSRKNLISYDRETGVEKR